MGYSEALLKAIKGHRFNFTSEAELQQGIALALGSHQIPFEREHRLDEAGRVDFYCGKTGIEVKIDGSRSEILRQLMKYAKNDKIEELILVTTKNRHRVMPSTINGKNLFVAYVSTGIF